MNVSVAFLGVGRMGGRMCTRLLAAGCRVTVFDPNEEAVAPLVALGARVAGSPADAAREADFILCSLPNPAIVRDALTDALGGAREGALIVDFSTGDPTVARELAAAAAARGVGFLDAPVSRGVVGAETGTLVIMAGGDADAIEQARPVLDVLASEVVHVGDVGAGQVVKLCNQMLTASITVALGEVLVTGVKAGVELEPLAAALRAGSGANRVLSDYFPTALFSAERTPGFALALMLKDLRLFVDAAEPDVPLSELVLRTYEAAGAAGLGEADSTNVAVLYERAAGVRLEVDQ